VDSGVIDQRGIRFSISENSAEKNSVVVRYSTYF
jgi:hypothetical protein